MIETIAIVLASGFSSRFSGEKLLQTLGNRTVIESVIGNLKKSQVSDIIVVAGPSVSAFLNSKGYGNVVINRSPQDGIGASISMGIRSISESASALITPGDMPFFSSGYVDRLIRLYRANPSSVVCCAHNGQRMSPAIFPPSSRHDLMALPAGKGGMHVISSGNYMVVELEVVDENILLDIDTRQDLERARLLAERYLSDSP